MLRPTIRLAVAAATASATVLTMLAGAASTAAAAPTVNYVALGDSYAAGQGAGDVGNCNRSPNSYPPLWAAANHPNTYVMAACGGATTGTVVNTQLTALSSSTTLVTVTDGGDNINWNNILETCNILFFLTSPCVSAINQAETQVSNDLPAAYDSMLAAIKAKAPNATVVVLDYPDFYDLSHNCIGLTQGDRTAINQGINLIDSLEQAAAGKYGDVFADVRTTFAGHEICDSANWINGVDWTDFAASYHPTASGQSGGYLPALTAALAAAAAHKS